MGVSGQKKTVYNLKTLVAQITATTTSSHMDVYETSVGTLPI